MDKKNQQLWVLFSFFLFLPPPSAAIQPYRQTHFWNGAFGNQHCMNIHHDSFFSVSLKASFDVHLYSHFIFLSTGILLPDSTLLCNCRSGHNCRCKMLLCSCLTVITTYMQNWETPCFHYLEGLDRVNHCSCCMKTIKTTINVSPPWAAPLLWKTSQSAWLECSLEAGKIK